MASTLLSMSSHTQHRTSRSRSPSTTDSPSPESASSDSHSSSDRDTHLSSLSPWGQAAGTGGLKDHGMEVDEYAIHHGMELDSDMTFAGNMTNGHSLDQYPGVSMDEIIMSNLPENSKQEMLLMEEFIRDGAFEPSPSAPTDFSAYISSPPAHEDSGANNSNSTSNDPPKHSQNHDSYPDSYVASHLTSSTTLAPSPSNEYLLSPDETKHTIFAGEYFNGEASADSPNPSTWSGEQQSVKTEVSLHNSPFDLPYDQIPSVVVSSKVVYPPPEACSNLDIVFPSVPMAGTKSRVETQIKLAFQLGIPASRSSGFPSSDDASTPSGEDAGSVENSPSIRSRDMSPEDNESRLHPSHHRVGTYRYLRLPYGTTTKRRSPNGKRESRLNDEDLRDTLQMSADVVCCSSPHIAVQSCQSCQMREAKRTARKLAARVRPPPGARKAKGKSGKRGSKKAAEIDQDSAPEDEEELEEPNVDGSILQFNCSDVLSFSSGSVILPMRITCYCRHHKEKLGFKIVFTLRDFLGRVVAQGSTPPILITDDHKSTNAVSKLPPMHPLRQTLHTTSTSPSPAPLPVPITEQQQPIPLAPADEVPRPPAKRRDIPDGTKKRRTKPYDGRPNRSVGVGPGIEGRQGVVLALHPAHARAQEARSQSGSAPVTRSPTPSVSETRFIHSLPPNGSQNQNPVVPSTPAPSEPYPIDMYPPTPPQTIDASPQATSLLPIPTESSLYPHLHFPLQPQVVSSSAAPFLSSLSFPAQMPKIRRLIPSSGPITGGIEITVLGENFHPNLTLDCVFGGVVASSTNRWSDNTLVCVLPPRAAPGVVAVEFKGLKSDDDSVLFNYVDESDRQLMELALQVVGLKMTGKIEEARNVAMRIVGTHSPTMTSGEVNHMNSLSESSMMHHQLLGSLSGVDLETLAIKLLTLLDVPIENPRRSTPSAADVINHKTATGQTLLHLAVLLELSCLVSCLLGRSIDIDACNNNGMTALHFAAMTGWREGVELLLNSGADPHIVDAMGLKAGERARNSEFSALADLLEDDSVFGEGESGEEGDDERWQSDVDDSEDAESEERSPVFTKPLYRKASTTRLRVPDESSEAESNGDPPPKEKEETSPLPKDVEKAKAKKALLDEKQDPSFVERLQRNLPHGILQNMQFPGFLQMQLPDVTWGALQNIPVFPVFVPLPNLPNWPGLPWNGEATQGEKKADSATPTEDGEKQQQVPPLAMLWTAYDNITNNAWRASWEKWTAHVTALQNANNNGSNGDLPPYSPRSEDQTEASTSTPTVTPQPEAEPGVATVLTPAPTPPRSQMARVTRRLGYGAVNVPDTEIEAFHYRPRRQAFYGKQDRMLILFWLPILMLAIGYALYTTLPIAFEGLSEASRRFLPGPLQRV